MTVYRNYEQEDKINEIYKKVCETDKERFDKIQKDKEKAFEWTEDVNKEYEKIVEVQGYTMGKMHDADETEIMKMMKQTGGKFKVPPKYRKSNIKDMKIADVKIVFDKPADMKKFHKMSKGKFRPVLQKQM